MKILVDALFLRPGVNGGGETYIRGLLSALSKTDRENSYLVLVTKEGEPGLPRLSANFETRAVGLRRGSIVSRLVYEQTALPVLARRWAADLAFFPANMMSLGLAALSIPSIVTIHDASFDYYQKSLPGYEPSLALWAKARLAGSAARLATRIVAISEFGRSEICRATGVSKDKVAVVHLGLTDLEGAPGNAEEIFSRFGISRPYVLAVGRIQKHKNFDRLVQVFAAARKGMNLPHQLVIAGRPGSGQADLDATIHSSGAGDCVRLTGFVQDQELAVLYANAEVFAMPSFYEGFGLPVLEAMKSGIPVIASAVCSLPEVGGDAALFFDPWDEPSMCRALTEMLVDRERAGEFSARGRVRAETFAWERTAATMREIFRSVTGQDAPVTTADQPERATSGAKLLEPGLTTRSKE